MNKVMTYIALTSHNMQIEFRLTISQEVFNTKKDKTNSLAHFSYYTNLKL